MQKLRSISAHQSLKNSQISINAQSRLREVNTRINNLLSKVQQETPDLEQQSTQNKILQQLQREKNQLLTQLIERDQQIREYVKRLNQMTSEILNLKHELRQYAQIPNQMEQLEIQCQEIIKENEQLKSQISSMKQSYLQTQAQTVYQLTYDLSRYVSSLQQLQNKSLNLLEFSCKQDYSNFQQILKVTYKQESIQITDNNIQNLKNIIDVLRLLIQQTEVQYNQCYSIMSDKIFDLL
ncbi:hypothetical protein pb186bvf_009463 [Paramecium bursaria]